VNFSDPSWWVATGGVKHGDFVAFCEAFVDPILHNLRAFGPGQPDAWRYRVRSWRRNQAVRSKSSGAFILSEKAEGRGKNGGWWILNFEFWMVD
jgi:hypothetical protein